MDINALSRPVLIIIRGLPGSGKTYLAEKLHESLGGGVMLDPDVIDTESDEYKNFTAELTKDGVAEAFWKYRYLRSQAYAGIESNQLIMWNQPFTNTDGLLLTIKRLNEHAERSDKELYIVIVEVEIDPQKARERVEARKNEGGHGPSAHTFDKFVSDYESFADKDYNVVKVDGEAEAQESIDKILGAIDI